MLGIISLTRYRDVDHGFVALVIIAAPRDRTILCTNALLRVHYWLAATEFTATVTQTHTWRERTWLAFNKQCRMAIIISKMVILTNSGRQPVGDRVLTHRPGVQRNAHNIRPTTALILSHNGRNRCCRHHHQREAEEAVASVLHTARSWAQLRASPADRPQSEQIWCSQVVGGWPRGLRQFGKGGTPSLTSQAMRRTALAGTLSGIRATWPNSERRLQ